MEYEVIYSRFLSKIDDPKLLSYDNRILYEILNDYLSATLAMPDVRKLFKSIIPDDDIEELEYTMNISIDKYSDDAFVLEVLAKGMVIQWMTQKIDTALSLATILGGKEEKMLKNDYRPNKERVKDLHKELKKMIRDSNYINCSYIGEGV